jgi:predicted SAM-dependent methyltransferase
MKLLNAGCGTHYANGWVNCDVWVDEHTKPDVQVTPDEPYPFEDSYFDAIYLGHVIEHIDWDKVVPFLQDMKRMAKPNAPILIVGPDVHKTIQRWKDGLEPWEMVLSTMEHQEHNYQPDREHQWWDGATHHWNCHHQRVEEIVKKLGFTQIEDYFDRIPNNATSKWWEDPSTNINWPVVGKWYWQFAIHCRA